LKVALKHQNPNLKISPKWLPETLNHCAHSIFQKSAVLMQNNTVI